MAPLSSVERQGVPFSGERYEGWPAHILRLSDIGIDRDAFIRDVRPSFDRTPWDMYDVMNRRAAIEQSVPAGGSLSAEQKAAIEAIQPHRRRAMRKYHLAHGSGSSWTIAPNEEHTFTQAVADHRARTREFALMEPDVSMHEGILVLLSSLGETVRAYRPDAVHIDAVIHQMTVIARPAEAGSPAPEGLHQDGCDYIVSALVIERSGVTGGVSRVRVGRDSAPSLEVQLAAGEGIFQADAGTSLWHEISPISLSGQSDTGHRMTFGVDIHVS
jgi:hypothetical protein